MGQKQRTVLQTPEPTARVDSREAWIVCGAAFLALVAAFGVAYSFGAVFTAIREEFDVSRSVTAQFFAISTFAYFVIGIYTGRLADRHGPRPVLVVGAIAMAAGLIVTSRVEQIWLGFATYGIGVGIAVACAYVPMVSTVGGWFETRRTTALGVSVAGIGVGTLVGAPAAKALTNAHGWRTAYVAMGIVAGSLMLIAAAGAKRPPSQAAESPAPRLFELVRDPQFRLLYIGMLLTSMILFVPFVFADDYLSAKGSDAGPLLIGVIGASSVVGRLGLGALAQRFGLAVLYLGSCAAIPLTFLIWLGAGTNLSLLLLFAMAMGITYGGFIALAPAVTAKAFGLEGLGGVLGALYTSAGVGGLVGAPGAAMLEGWFGYDTAIVIAMFVGLSAVPFLWLVARPAPQVQSVSTGGSG